MENSSGAVHFRYVLKTMSIVNVLRMCKNLFYADDNTVSTTNIKVTLRIEGREQEVTKSDLLLKLSHFGDVSSLEIVSELIKKA
jgi:hypothetical protein